MPKLKLLSSHDEAGNIRTFVFETGGLEWKAGQSQGYTLPQAGATEAENHRWFTIASAPSEGEIHISTRVSASAFKRALNAMKPGDEIDANNLEGEFIWEEEPSAPVVMVAGGIGVTPFRSILLERDATGKQLNATLLVFNRTDEVPFRKEFEELAGKHAEFSYVVVVGEAITADAILSRVPQAKEHALYLSGAEPMVDGVGAELEQRGVLVKKDHFPGYDAKTY